MATRIFMKVAAAALIFPAACLLFPSSLPAQAQIETQELVFPQMAVGGGWESELTIVAQGAVDSTGTISFYDPSGGALAVSVDGSMQVTSIPYTLPYRSSRTYKLTSNTFARGWILVSNNDPINKGSINGILTYRFRQGGVLKSQVGVLPSRTISKAHFPYDNTNGNKTAFALAMYSNPGGVTFVRYDEAGHLLESRNLPFDAFNQQAMYVQELFPNSVNTRGFIMINSAVSFNILALNDNGNNYSSTAVLPAVFERELNIVFAEVTTYHLRLVREGNILYGIAERVVPGMIHGVSGSIVGLANGQKSLQLTIYTSTADGGTGLSLTLMARVNNDALLSASGKAYGLFDNSTAPVVGTFSFSSPPGAQF